jgi:hypothetical protein
LGVRAVLGSGRAGDLLLPAVTAGCGRDPLHIFWERYHHLLEVMARERRIATHRELADMVELRDAAYAYWDMHPEAGAEWPEWPPSALVVARKLGEVPPDLEPLGPFGPLEVVVVGDERDARTSSRKTRVTKRRAGTPETFYDRAEIRRVLVLWRGRASSPQQISQKSLARKGFSRMAVRRVIRLDEYGAFELGPRGGLRLHGIDGEFRAAPKKVSLRSLERALGLPSMA